MEVIWGSWAPLYGLVGVRLVGDKGLRILRLTLGSAGDGAGLGLVSGPGEGHGVPTAAGSAGDRGGSGGQQRGACRASSLT